MPVRLSLAAAAQTDWQENRKSSVGIKDVFSYLLHSFCTYYYIPKGHRFQLIFI